jgi:hypothetical protein
LNRYSINLSSRPFQNNTIHWVGFVLVFAGLLALTWYDVYSFRVSGQGKARWAEALGEKRARLESLSTEADRITREVGRMDLAELNERSAFANDIILSRLFSWSGLFDRLEDVQPELVRVRSIRPRVSDTAIQIAFAGATKEHGSLLAFEDRLLRSEYFSLVYPEAELSQQKRSEIEFTLSFNYLPDGEGKPPVAEGTAEESQAGGDIEQGVINLDELFEELPDEESKLMDLDDIPAVDETDKGGNP